MIFNNQCTKWVSKQSSAHLSLNFIIIEIISENITDCLFSSDLFRWEGQCLGFSSVIFWQNWPIQSFMLFSTCQYMLKSRACTLK